ncbi:MAG: flagellar filament capping protein FliD, partial [Desulfomonilia bacterium]|nr:flagellar filament capping protein FliD [Desulfomonilia bacterium]
GTFESAVIRNRQITAGQDARIILDGTTITRSTNQISDVIAGVTLNLRSQDPDAEITLNITRDYDGIREKISEFVEKYNDLMTYISTQFTPAGDGENAPALFADSSLMSIRSSIRNVILSGVNGLDSTLTHLSLIGITSDRYGKLSIDSSKLDGYLRTNFNDVVNLFVVQGTSSNSDLSYLRSGRTTEGGSYEIEITQAATRASVVGTGFSGTLNEDAVLTISDGSGREVAVNVSAGWTITAIVNAINAELSQAGGSAPAVTAQNTGGELQIVGSAYGDYSFTLAVTGGNLGLAEGTYTGTDVIGRIREEGSETWMTMTGKGQTLTGDEGQGVEGLMIKYAGTALGTFDFQFITGIGEKLDRALYSMTDAISGYVAGKQKSLQNRMNSIDQKIEAVERRIERREEMLMKQFITMERLVAQMQSQQQWLTSQISLLNSQWNQNS